MLPLIQRLAFCLEILLATAVINSFQPRTAQGQSPTVLESKNENLPHHRSLSLETWPVDNAVKMSGPLPSVIQVWLSHDPQRSPLEFGFNTDATEVTVFLPPTQKPKSDSGKSPLTLEFLITETTTTHPDGVVVLSALDSEVIGTQAKLETHPGSHRIGFWLRKDDYVQWDAGIPAGNYDAELVYSRAFETGTEVDVIIGETKLTKVLEKTGSWYRYRTMPLGQVEIDKKPTQRIEVRVAKIVNGGVMNLKAIVLTPAK